MARRKKDPPSNQCFMFDFGEGDQREVERVFITADADQGFYRLTIDRPNGENLMLYLSPVLAARMMFQTNRIIKQAADQQENSVGDAS